MNEENLNKARALYYGMFSRCFVFTTDNSRYFELTGYLDTLSQNPLDKPSAEAFATLKELVKSDSNVDFMLEFDEIFHSPETQTVRVTASYYDENIESGKKRIEMQNFLAKTKIRRDEKTYSDYEDHIGFIFAVMSELSNLIADGQTEYKNTAHCIFEQILNEFIDEFSRELYEHESAKIFKNIVILLKSFIEFERVYLEVNTPVLKAKPVLSEIKEELSDEERERRAKNKLLRAQGPKKQESGSCELNPSYEVEEDF
ncbi:molecular chaperone TorD family protein [Sulfurimonas sp.]|uniref:TorD/DmsD family molecular chaperone n=1 Tax=Sulfurimonas sp. TaxID=2022749 RepID=UPI002AB2AD6F|nr:molecular chaperone TorD family protein [Sulfurimonas sp.]